MIIEYELKQLFSGLANKESIDRPIKSGGICLYGAGSMGEMALDFLERINISPKYIIDNQKKGKIREIDIINPIDIPKEDLSNLTFILCIVTAPILPIIHFLHDLGCKDVRHFYDYTEIMLKTELTNGWSHFNLDRGDIDSITSVCKDLEHDEYSLAHYLQFLWWRLRRVEKSYKQFPVLSNKKYFKAPCMPKLTDDESFLDGGAHFGTTIESFIETTNGKFETIWAIEPDENNLSVMKKNLNKNLNIDYMSIALSDKNGSKGFVDGLGFASKIDKNGSKEVQTQTIDGLNVTPTIIKLHLEGYELKALEGSVETTKEYRPILMVLADHNEDGLYEIAQFLMSLKEYKIYFNLHDYCGNSAIYYAIPKERDRNG